MSKIAFNSNPLGTGTFTIASPNSNSDRTFTLPDTTGTVLTSAGGTITGDVTINVGSGSRIFQTTDANNYARFTQSSGSAQVGLFRTGAPSGGMYIGGDGDQFSVWSSGFQRRLNVSQSGYVTTPNQPAFYVQHTAAAGVNAASGTVVILTAVQFDRTSSYSTSTGRYTAPIAGCYQFFFGTIKSDSGRQPDSFVSRFRLRKNGVNFSTELRLSENGGYGDSTSMVAMVNLAAGDFVDIFITDSGGWYGSTYAHFGGYLIG